ncbi:MAG: HEAT repeat domain-containing protein [Planctomycetes bacterium]|nr:HEAT repeat domain-containing protein [Planctomycetota bacterium]
MKQLIVVCLASLLLAGGQSEARADDKAEGSATANLPREVLEALSGEVNPQAKAAVSALIEVVRKEAMSGDKALFDKASGALVKIGVLAARDVGTLLDDKEKVEVGRAATKILGDIGPMALVGGAVKPLTERLKKDPDDTVRKNAAVALGELRVAGAFQALIDALPDKAPEVRLAAAEALGKIFEQQKPKAEED